MNSSKHSKQSPAKQSPDNRDRVDPIQKWDGDSTLRRYFVAVLPTAAVQEQVNTLKQELGETYDCKPVWNSPPHVTLLPPFERSPDHVSRLHHWLESVVATMPKFELQFDGLGAFPPRVLFVDVVRSPELMKLQTELDIAFDEYEAPYESSHRPDSRRRHGDAFNPHMTLARCRPKRRKGKNPFHAIWPEICDRPFHASSPIETVILLEYLKGQWEICRDYPLS